MTHADLIPVILKAFTEAHPAGVRFFHGMEEYENIGKEKGYPAVLLAPVLMTDVYKESGVVNEAYGITGLVLDQLPGGEGNDKRMDLEANMRNIASTIITQFTNEFVRNQGAIVEGVEFQGMTFTTMPLYTPILEFEDNLIGFQFSFVAENNMAKPCDVPEIFS